MANEASVALTNRALRNIRTVCHVLIWQYLGVTLTIIQELEYLTDSSIISPQQLSSILSQLPAQTPLHAPLHSPDGIITTPVENFGNPSLKEHYAPTPSPAPLPPPAYAAGPQILGIASALYAYTPTDAGDLALQQNDRIQVLEHMNNDCKK